MEMETVLINCTRRLARAFGREEPWDQGWADHAHVPMRVPRALLTECQRRSVYEWRTERTSDLYDADDATCAKIYATRIAPRPGSVHHFAELDARTAHLVSRIAARFAEYVVCALIDEATGDVQAVAHGLHRDAHAAGC